MFDRALIDVGQHRVRAAERQQRGLGEEPSHLRQRAVHPAARREQRQRRRPQHEADRHAQAPAAWPRKRACAGVGVSSSISARSCAVVRRAVRRRRCESAPAPAVRRRAPTTAAPQRRSPGTAPRTRRSRRTPPRRSPTASVLQRARADAMRRMHDDRDDRGLDAVEHAGHRPAHCRRPRRATTARSG